MLIRHFAIWSSLLLALAYAALGVMYFAAARPGYAAFYVGLSAAWTLLARLSAKVLTP